jgi:hypothetical protein
MRLAGAAAVACLMGTGSFSGAAAFELGPDDYVEFWREFTAPERSRRFPGRAAPATLGVASGFGLERGTIVVGAAATNARDRGKGGNPDGSFALGIGLSDPRDKVGIDFVLSSTSVGDPRDGLQGILGEGGFLAEGSLALKFSRELEIVGTDTRFSVAVGAANLLPWGSAEEVGVNYFIVGTALTNLHLLDGPAFPVNLTLGVGSAVSGVERDPGLFAGIGMGVTERMAMSVGWLGDEWIVGATIYPLSSGRMQISIAAGDVTQQNSEGRILLTMGYSWGGVF